MQEDCTLRRILSTLLQMTILRYLNEKKWYIVGGMIIAGGLVVGYWYGGAIAGAVAQYGPQCLAAIQSAIAQAATTGKTALVSTIAVVGGATIPLCIILQAGDYRMEVYTGDAAVERARN